MMNKILILALCCTLFLMGCSKNGSDVDETIDPSNSFLPMQIGNYWRVDEGNIISITDTLRIDGDLFYKFESLWGYDVVGTEYLRLDKDNNLIERSPLYPESVSLRAKFNAAVGTKFFTLNNQTVNDYEVTLKSIENDVITFEFDMVYHQNLKGHTHIVAYKKGLGFVDNWTEVKIGNVIYKFD